MHILGDINFLVESDVKIGMTFPVRCTQRRGRFMGIRIDNSNLVMYSIPDCKRSDRTWSHVQSRNVQTGSRSISSCSSKSGLIARGRASSSIIRTYINYGNRDPRVYYKWVPIIPKDVVGRSNGRVNTLHLKFPSYRSGNFTWTI